ncbi:hypothetical protein B0H17DRAFT_1209169 [Mycena rosella]|uniref:Uncharacterized protein n=1 Tax=Mycena rosella TaxID=1033263 RepID=A0AAD7CZ23_MYCRO|nr:hypothetical protein B0H17DRAFT_1209169 [Mycena rosella]
MFKGFKKITLPELVVSLNDGTVPWKAPSAVSDDAGKLSVEFEKLTKRFDKVERDVGVRMNATHSLISGVQKSTLLLTERVTELTTVQQHTNLTLTAMQQEVALMRACTPLDAAERFGLGTATTPTSHAHIIAVNTPRPSSKAHTPVLPLNPASTLSAVDTLHYTALVANHDASTAVSPVDAHPRPTPFLVEHTHRQE